MNEAALQDLARQIAQQQLHLSWPYALILVALSAVVGALANFAASYFRRRGETQALKADIDELLRQSKAMTHATEEVKTSIAQAAWASREGRTIRRAKLEDLTLAVYEMQEWLTKRRNSVVHGAEMDAGPSPIKKVVVLAKLYFPELELESKRMLNIQLRYDMHQLETSARIRAVGDDPQERAKVVAESSVQSRALFGEHLLAEEQIVNISSSLMQEILGITSEGVDQTSAPQQPYRA
jgi:hypothetical protein